MRKDKEKRLFSVQEALMVLYSEDFSCSDSTSSSDDESICEELSQNSSLSCEENNQDNNDNNHINLNAPTFKDFNIWYLISMIMVKYFSIHTHMTYICT